jgi:hypothetical protein
MACRAVFVLGLLVLPIGGAFAQGAAPRPATPEMMESCPGLVARNRPPFMPASLRLAALKEGEVRINYIRPEPGIKFVLRGWKEDGKPAGHDIQVQDVRVRSVATNIRDYYGGGGTQRHGNSIFIFEVANLCIAHLGHLHHTLNQQQLNEIGRVDVVLVPVDGGATLDLEGMIEVLTALKAPLMIPMHFFSTYTLNRFLERISKDWDVERAEVPSVVVSKHTLPAKPKLLVLPGRSF